MNGILTKEQSERVKAIKEEIRKLNIDGWMCEGHDGNLNQFFNNDLEDGFFLADYDGNIVSSSMKEISDDLKKYAKLMGDIRYICLEEEREEDFER